MRSSLREIDPAVPLGVVGVTGMTAGGVLAAVSEYYYQTTAVLDPDFHDRLATSSELMGYGAGAFILGAIATGVVAIRLVDKGY